MLRQSNKNMFYSQMTFLCIYKVYIRIKKAARCAALSASEGNVHAEPEIARLIDHFVIIAFGGRPATT